MSRHPYYILADFVEHARRFYKVESELTSPVPSGHKYPVFVEVHRLEGDLARSGGWCLHFWGEYTDRTLAMKPPPAIQIRRDINKIGEKIRGRFRHWGWSYLLSAQGMHEVDRRMVAHRKTEYLPLLEAALSWRSGTDVEEHSYADSLANEAEGLGIVPTMTPEEGKRVFWDRHRAWYMTPALGESIPSVSNEDHDELLRTVERLGAYLNRSFPPHELDERYGQLEQEAPEIQSSIPAIGHQQEMQPKENETDEAVESTKRVLALDEDGRGIKCIDLAGAKVWEGQWHDPDKLHGYRFNLFLTKCKRWVKGHQTIAFGYEVAPHLKQRGLIFEVLHHGEAVAWFSENNKPHPPELLDAFDHPAQKSLETSQSDSIAENSQANAKTSNTPGSPQAALRDVREEDSNKETPEEKNRRVFDHLSKHPDATSAEIGEATGIPEQTVRRQPAWKTHRSKVEAEQKDRQIKTRSLSERMIAAIRGKDADPSEIAAQLEIDEREYLENCSPGERAEYHKMERTEQINTLWIWKNDKPSRSV